MTLLLRGQTLAFPPQPLVMGIVNLSEDSFSGDGVGEAAGALELALRQWKEGAAIIDVGAESARTNREAISEGEETGRLLGFLEGWEERWAGVVGRPLLSINTWRPGVARAVLARGGDLLNDIGGLPTAENARTCAETGAALLIMHTVGEPKVPHTHVRYGDVWEELERFFTEKMELAMAAGVPREGLVLDLGIDFAKGREDNLRILRELGRLRGFGRPVLLPVSRKTVIGEVLGIAEPARRDAGTVACVVQGALAGAGIVRVHDVRAAVQAIGMVGAVVGVDRVGGVP